MPIVKCCGYTDDDTEAICPKCGKVMKSVGKASKGKKVK
jgi:tRNA(Ile2) C34 agmatinyltransferase TiaS